MGKDVTGQIKILGIWKVISRILIEFLGLVRYGYLICSQSQICEKISLTANTPFKIIVPLCLNITVFEGEQNE